MKGNDAKCAGLPNSINGCVSVKRSVLVSFKTHCSLNTDISYDESRYSRAPVDSESKLFEMSERLSAADVSS